MTITDYLQKLCQHCGVDPSHIQITLEETDTHIKAHIELPEEESGLFIGYHGETLDSVQRMVRLTFREELEAQDKRFILNVNQYREQRQDQLAERVITIAQRVLETGESYTFNYLPSHDRFLVHTTLSENSEFAELESVSEGEGRERYLTIRLKATE